MFTYTYILCLESFLSLGNFLFSTEDILSTRIFFTSIAVEPTIDVSLAHQCGMLESSLGIFIVHQCLQVPESAPSIICSICNTLLKK